MSQRGVWEVEVVVSAFVASPVVVVGMILDAAAFSLLSTVFITMW
jgi:hypothetical protein